MDKKKKKIIKKIGKPVSTSLKTKFDKVKLESSRARKAKSKKTGY